MTAKVAKVFIRREKGVLTEDLYVPCVRVQVGRSEVTLAVDDKAFKTPDEAQTYGEMIAAQFKGGTLR